MARPDGDFAHCGERPETLSPDAAAFRERRAKAFLEPVPHLRSAPGVLRDAEHAQKYGIILYQYNPYLQAFQHFLYRKKFKNLFISPHVFASKSSKPGSKNTVYY